MRSYIVVAVVFLLALFVGLQGQSTLSLGSAVATTQSPGDNSTKVATTAYVEAKTVTVACGGLPALTGDTTTSAGSCATTTGKVNGIAITGTPAVGNVPVATSTSAAAWGPESLQLLSNGAVALPYGATMPVVRDLARTCATCTTNVDLYTPASGHQALVNGCAYTNTGANSTNFTLKVKIGGTYFALYALSTIASGGASVNTTSGFVLDSTMTLAVLLNNAATSTTVVSCSVVDFVTPTTGPRIRTIIVTTFASGDNTLYTVPASTTAMVVAAGQIGVLNLLNYINNSGNARTIQWNVVPSGGAVSATGNAISQSASVADAASSVRPFDGTMTAGDFISLNTSANTAGQVAWFTVVERTVGGP